VWGEAVLVLASAAVGGSIGSIATALLGGRNERARDLRTRQLAAADDWADAAYRALIAARDADREVRKMPDNDSLADPSPSGGLCRPEIQQEIDLLVSKTDDALGHMSRLELLFGDGAESAGAASAMIDELRALTRALGDWPKSLRNPTQRRDFNSHFAEAERMSRSPWIFADDGPGVTVTQ
jgi:hypothetical protein